MFEDLINFEQFHFFERASVRTLILWDGSPKHLLSPPPPSPPTASERVHRTYNIAITSYVCMHVAMQPFDSFQMITREPLKVGLHYLTC